MPGIGSARAGHTSHGAGSLFAGWRLSLSTLHSPICTLHRLQGCQVSALYSQYFHYSSSQAGLFESDAHLFTASHSSMFCRDQPDNYHALCSEHRNNLCKYQIVQRNARLERVVLRISSCEGVGRNCDGSCPAHTISGASPTSDNLTIHAIQWPSPETRGRRHSYKYDGSPTCSVCSEVCSGGECQSCREECGQESLARAGVAALARRQSDIGHRTVNISRECDFIVTLWQVFVVGSDTDSSCHYL